MYIKMAQIAVPVLPLPELQCTTIIFSGSAINKVLNKEKQDRGVGAFITLDPLERLFGHIEQKVEGWAVMIRPVVLSGTAPEESLFVVGCSL